jgi:hypothetical protein
MGEDLPRDRALLDLGDDPTLSPADSTDQGFDRKNPAQQIRDHAGIPRSGIAEPPRAWRQR